MDQPAKESDWQQAPDLIHGAERSRHPAQTWRFQGGQPEYSLEGEGQNQQHSADDHLGGRRVGLQIDPKCKELIRALRAIEFEPGRSSYDKRSKFGHIIDATGYLTLAISRGLTPWSLGQSGFKIYG